MKRVNRKTLERRLDTLASELCRLLAGGRCFHCGCDGHEPHHIISRNHKRQRWNQYNLVYLCRTCHRKAHDEFIEFNRGLDGSVKIWSLPDLLDLEKELKIKIKEIGL